MTRSVFNLASQLFEPEFQLQTNIIKVVGEWKAKADDLHAELDACHSECRNFSAETFRMKAALDDTNEQLDIVRRENKNLADEIKVPVFSLEFDPLNPKYSRIFWIS